MSFYARVSPKLAGQLTADLFVLVWTISWIMVGRALTTLIDDIAGPARSAAQTARNIQADMSRAAEQAAGVPIAGQELRKPFDAAAVNVGELAQSAQDQVVAIEQVALAAGIVIAAIPIAILIAVWLPRRVRFYVRNRAARAFLNSQADLDLFALRAMATEPLHVLGKISPDPVAAWRAGDRAVVDRLADIELRRSGLNTAAELRRRGELPQR